MNEPKRKKPVQELLAIDMEKRSPAAHSLAVNLYHMKPGVVVGDNQRVFACPLCGRGCLPKTHAYGMHFVHSGLLESTSHRSRWLPKAICKAGTDQVALLVSKGLLTIKRGQVSATRAP